MNSKHLKMITAVGILSLVSFSGCSLSKDEASARIGQSNLGTGNPADLKGVLGVPGVSGPTGEGVIARIENCVKGNAVSTAGNFAKALAQMKSNLPQDANPLRASGYDQIPLLAYAACSDIAPAMYGVTGVSITGAKPALVAAGVNFVDQLTGGLGSTGPKAAQVASLFGTLVDNNAQISGETIQMAFISVCMAGCSFGTMNVGY